LVFKGVLFLCVYFMASFAAVSRLPSGSSTGRSPSYTLQKSPNWLRRKQNAHNTYKEAFKVYFNAERAYKNYNKKLSGGLIGYLKRRVPGNTGQQARNARNRSRNQNQTLKNLKAKMNAAKINANKKLRIYSSI